MWKILKEVGVPDHLIYLLRSLYASQETIELDMEKLTSLKLGKEYDRLYIITSLFYLTYMQSISCEMPDWMNHKLESRLLG